MGNDGGSIPDRRDLVRTRPKAEQADKANQTRARWFFCALSKRPLQEPIVSCALGKLYNKDSILEYLLDKTAYGDGEVICGHIRSLKDVKVLKLTHNPSPNKSTLAENDAIKAEFVCPLTFKEMIGSVPFVYLRTCGCVFSQAGLKTVSHPAPSKDESAKSPEGDPEEGKQLHVCPQCGAKYDKTEDIQLLNPPPEEEERMRDEMDRRRLAEPVKIKGRKRKAAGTASEEPVQKKKSGVNSTNTGITSVTRAVAASLAEEEAKRKAGMSDAVKSLYTSKDGPKRKETFMTMGTFTRYA